MNPGATRRPSWLTAPKHQLCFPTAPTHYIIIIELLIEPTMKPRAVYMVALHPAAHRPRAYDYSIGFGCKPCKDLRDALLIYISIAQNVLITRAKLSHVDTSPAMRLFSMQMDAFKYSLAEELRRVLFINLFC